jgi:hypothetical protein
MKDGREKPVKSYWGGRLSTFDLLVLTSLDQLIFKLKILFFLFFTKQATLMRRSTVLSLPPHLVFPGKANFTPITWPNSGRCFAVVGVCLHDAWAKNGKLPQLTENWQNDQIATWQVEKWCPFSALYGHYQNTMLIKDIKRHIISI